MLINHNIVLEEVLKCTVPTEGQDDVLALEPKSTLPSSFFNNCNTHLLLQVEVGALYLYFMYSSNMFLADFRRCSLPKSS